MSENNYKPDKFLISIQDDNLRSTLKEVFKMIIDDGRPLNSVYTDGNLIYIEPKSE